MVSANQVKDGKGETKDKKSKEEQVRRCMDQMDIKYTYDGNYNEDDNLLVLLHGLGDTELNYIQQKGRET